MPFMAVVVPGMTIDPRISSMPGRSMVFTDQADNACTKREAP